jgi:MFS family permease
MGRSTAFNATLFFTAVFGFLASLSNSFGTLCVTLFFLGSSVGVSTLNLPVLSPLTLGQGSMPTDGTLLLEQLPREKQYLVTALSVFFSVGSVVSAVAALLVLPNNSCPLSAELPFPSTLAPPPCDVETQNLGWKYVLITHALIVRITRCILLSPTQRSSPISSMARPTFPIFMI